MTNWDREMSLDDIPEPSLAELVALEEMTDEDFEHVIDQDLLDIAISLDDLTDDDIYEDDYFKDW